MIDEPEELTPEEIKALKLVVKREEAAGLIWKWFTSFLAVAIPVVALYTWYKSQGGQP